MPVEQHASTSELPSSPATSHASDTSDNIIAESEDNSNKKDHELHPDCPDSLACLPDTDGRPQHTLPVILRCTILGSPRKRLTIREIYAAMESKYSYYKTAGPTWKVNSFYTTVGPIEAKRLIAIRSTPSLLEPLV
jgi:hypothetical protein